MADKAYITPKLLKWARESARISIESAAAKISVSIDKLKHWEDGIEQPTIKQAQTLAKVYKRPFALLFLPEIPKDFQPLQDYRKKDSKELSTASIFIIREIQQKQAWISEVNEDNNENRIPFVGRFSIKDNPITVANDILKTLEINPSKYRTDKPIREWIEKAELKGIFISRTSFIHSRLKIDANELQGFAIADPYAPFIFINTADWNSPQLFTLVHELAHIWIAETGISNVIELDFKNTDKFHPIELFCNEVAANALMPTSLIMKIDKIGITNKNELFKMAKNFGVSTFALLIRLYNLGIINYDIYSKLKYDSNIEFEAFLKREEEKKAKEKAAGPNPYLLRLNKNGRLFTQIVLDAFRGGTIEPTQASFLLNVKINNFHKLEAQLYK